MRNLFLAFILLLLFQRCSQQPAHPPKMFRDNVTHESYLATDYHPVYDTKAWQFDAGSPIRSTALVDNNNVFFGTAAGVFFAIDKKNGKEKWRFNIGEAIHSSAAGVNGRIFFSDNGQTLYCLDEEKGSLQWKLDLGVKIPYPWRFDYYYSSPIIYDNKVYIGSDDGNLYAIDATSGRKDWTFKTSGIVRGTPAIYKDQVLFGDTEGIFYCLDMKGSMKWNYKVIGQPLNLDTIGFDRKAIFGAPVVCHDRIIFGSRDGYLYALDVNSGKLMWTVNHHVSWVISTVAVKDSIVVTGTSDGQFVQAINLYSGKEIWKAGTPMPDWSSPLINNDHIYEGCFNGQLYCFDLATGKKLSQFATNGMVLSSPVIDDSLLYIGSDDGHLYALTGRSPMKDVVLKQLVYYDKDQVKIYFHHDAELRINNFLQASGFISLATDSLVKAFSMPAANSCIVFVTDYFPKVITEQGSRSLLRKFLDGGGRIILLGNNPLFMDIDESTKEVRGFGRHEIDSVLGLHYGPIDTRAFGGLFPGFPNAKGRSLGLPDFWISTFGTDKSQVDIVLGENENGQASAFVKNYANGGRLIQIWMNQELPENMDAIVKLSTAEL